MSDQELPIIAEETSGEHLHVSESESQDHDVDVPQIDYSGYDKKDFASLLKVLSQESDVRKADKQLRLLKPALDDLRERLQEEALNRFVADGSNPEDFEMRRDEFDLVIDGAIKLIRDKRLKYNREQDENRKSNLARKQELLVSLRRIVEQEDSKGSFQEFKKIQEEWRATGPVPQTYSKEIWDSYHALVDRFFDHRSIYFELLELDRRRNLDSKKELCIRAEKLSDTGSENIPLSAALREINELHQEWKHIGPVPNDEKEAIWQRFRTACGKIYERRDSHLKEVNARLKENRKAKTELLEKIAALKEFESNSIKDWNQKSKEVADLQKTWSKMGPVEKSKSRELNRQFWAIIKAFYARKGKFFKQLDAGRQDNLLKKQGLIEQVKSLQSADDLQQAIEKVKQIQREWKEIGPVPDKVSNKLFAEFKSACDFFFERRRTAMEEAGKTLEENFELKVTVIGKISGSNGAEAVATVKELILQFHTIGHVPKSKISEIQQRFQSALNTFLSTIPVEENFREKVSLEMELIAAPNDPNASRRLQQQEYAIRKKLAAAENELSLLRNNLEFFARSKNADAVREEFRVRIEAAEAEVSQLKSKLRLIRSMGS